MKKIIAIICFVVSTQITFAQKLNIDSMLQQVSLEKDANKKVDIISRFYNSEINNNPPYIIEVGRKMLKQSQDHKDDVEEASAYSVLGQGYRLLGSNIRALEYHHKAIAMAEKNGNNSLLGIAENQIAHIYKDREQYDKAIQFYKSSAMHTEKGNIERIKSWPLSNLSTIYLSVNDLDSSLMYAQRGYEIDHKYNPTEMIFSFLNLAGVHSKLGNAQLAVTYYNMALGEAEGTTLVRYLNMIYTGLAQHYQSVNEKDSCEAYARKGIAAVTNTSFFYLSSKPAQLLADMYEKTNCDSTLKYAKIFKTATDSLNSRKANQQIQLMTFDEDLRQQELAAEKIKAYEERKENIQYALIGLGIIILLSLYLLLSRSFITNTKMIEFLGVVALLIVFEFLNLLLHPFLERITHHSPVLMLLALVCIAALLVPLHHKIEHWATHKLVEKNKAIRLAAAKKTIEKLDSGS
ncbi:MAG: tetratricopeptide repeat protein [Ferruginibacter sp.]